MNDDISKQVEEYLARGGSMTTLKSGVTSKFKNISKKAQEYQLAMQKNQVKPKSGHQNIRIQKTTIAVYMGHGPHKTFPKGNDEAAALKLAIECRDRLREDMGLPPAKF